MSEKKYKGIKWVLKKQIEKNSTFKWAWKQGADEEFVCVYLQIPNWSKQLYTAQQLLDKLNESNNTI